MSRPIVSKLLTLINNESQPYLSSRTQGDPCWAPPPFPENGRLALTPAQINANHEKLINKEKAHQQKAQKENKALCCKTLHVSLFFDGTNNNNYNDTEVAQPPHPSNISKLYHASSANNDAAMDKGFYSYYIPGVGTPFPEIQTYEYYSAGLTFATGSEARISWGLIQICNALYHAVTGEDIPLAKRRAVLEEMSSDSSFNSALSNEDIMSGIGGASFGSFVGTSISGGLGAIGGMVGGVIGGGAAIAYHKSTKLYNPVAALDKLLAPLKWELPYKKPKIVALKIYAYGFSRGAAEARTFAYWLDNWLDYHHKNVGQFYTRQQKNGFSYVPKGTFYGVPVSIEFLGLFDTVAAVGLANVVPMATGHNGWASGTQQLPKSSLVKNICHLVAAHEQRQSFAVDSIRTPEGNYPANAVEVIYPGMHSDVGGAYPPNDQGKSRNGSKELLSQIALHDMYAAAIDAGAPLAITQASFSQLPELASQYTFRIMNDNSTDEFAISEDLINKFNAWRTYSLPAQTPLDPASALSCFNPLRFSADDLESVMEIQLILITAWRIGRYATSPSDSYNLTHQAFFQSAPLHEKITVQPYDPAFPAQASAALAEESSKNADQITAIAKRRDDIKKTISDLQNWMPGTDEIGPPLFDATNARGQLWEAALEFKADLEGMTRPQPLIDMSSKKTKSQCMSLYQPYEKALGEQYPILQEHLKSCENAPEYTFPLGTSLQASVLRILKVFNPFVYKMTDQDEHQEYLSLKTISLAIYEKLISPQMKGITNEMDLANIIQLFDDQVHDSRAWFMHSDSGILEPFSSYFLSRMIYFGEKWSKSMQLIVSGDTIYGYHGNIEHVGVAYKPLYGIVLIDLLTGEEISINTSEQPPSTHTIMEQIHPIAEKQSENAHNNTMQTLRKIAQN